MGESYDPTSISEFTNLTKQQTIEFGIQKGVQTSSKFMDLYKQEDERREILQSRAIHTIEEEETQSVTHTSV